MVRCKHCKSVFPQKYVSFGSPFLFPACPLCRGDVGMDALDKTAESSNLVSDGSNYDKYAYDKAANTVDIAICRLIDGELNVLLIKRKFHPCKGKWAIPGGFLNVNTPETLDDAALRELKEETGVSKIAVHQLKTYGDPDRDPRDRIITTMYYALVNEEQFKKEVVEAQDDAEEYKWAPLHKVRGLAFDHTKILLDLAKELRDRAANYPLAFSLVPREFTWTQLKTAYEALLGRSMHRTNFPRQVSRLYEIKDLGKKAAVEGSGGRPASLLRFAGRNDLF